MRILILEDDVARSRFFLERFGQYNILITEDSQEAIRSIENDVFDYIFLDNDLGKGNGEGRNVVDFLFYNPTNKNNKAIIIAHSWNIPAVQYMKNRLPNIISAPFNTENFLNLNLDI